MVWLTLLLLIAQAACWAAALTGSNTCSRKEAYTVTMRVHEKKPVTTKTYTWCFKMPPRCTKYKVELVDTYRIQSEPRTRWVHECCAGYVADESSSVCRAVCPSSCLHGACSKPGHCTCYPGYTGLLCDTRCAPDRWGRDCQQSCSCEHGALCNHETGKCACASGWWGSRCESTCPDGSYGERCQGRCSCEGNATCHHVTGSCNPRTPEVIQRLIDLAPSNSSSVTHDSPISEPLVTTSEYASNMSEGSHSIRYDPQTSEGTFAKNNTSNGDRTLNLNESASYIAAITTSLPDTTTVNLMFIPTSDSNTHSGLENVSSTPGYNSSTDITALTEKIQSTTSDRGRFLELNNGRRFLEEESHEDQLDHLRSQEMTESHADDVFEDQLGNLRTKQVTEFPAEDVSQDQTTAFDEAKLQGGDEANITPDVTRQISEIKEHSTQVPVQQLEKIMETTESAGRTIDKTEEQRKKTTDQKKFRHKERVKDVPNQKPIRKDHDWAMPEPDTEEPLKDHEQVQEGSHRDHMEKITDQSKPKRMSEQNRVKEVSDIGLMKIAPNQERQLSGGKSAGYSDFLSSFSIATGVSTGIIVVAAFITLMARCRRPKPAGEAGVEMTAMDSKPPQQEEGKSPAPAEEATLPVVRPLFFSPVYLPGDVSPTEGNGGLILTAVFSTPATNIHDIYRQQDLLRETLASHYDVPPPASRLRDSCCTSVGTAEPEHLYEELPCWRERAAPAPSESQC